MDGDREARIDGILCAQPVHATEQQMQKVHGAALHHLKPLSWHVSIHYHVPPTHPVDASPLIVVGVHFLMADIAQYILGQWRH